MRRTPDQGRRSALECVAICGAPRPDTRDARSRLRRDSAQSPGPLRAGCGPVLHLPSRALVTTALRALFVGLKPLRGAPGGAEVRQPGFQVDQAAIQPAMDRAF